MPIHVRSLGGLTITLDEREVAELSGQPVRCGLLLYLAVERRATRDQILGLLWPERDPERARHSLSQTLYELRKLLGEGCVEATGEIVSAGPGIESVDALAFQEAAEAGESRRALDLYRGRFLEGVHLAPTREFEAWTDRVRSRLHRLDRRVRSESLATLRSEGRADAALRAAREWVELDPLEDEAQHHLIELLVASGRRAEALRQYERYRELLARELDVEPLDETRELVPRIRVGGGGGEPGREEPDEDVIAPEGRGKTSPETLGAGGGSRPGPEAEVGEEEVTGLGKRALRAGLAKVVLFYLLASFVVLQAVDLFIDRLGLPDAFFGAALVLLVAGLPVVVTTALIQAGALASSASPTRFERAAVRWFTWRNAVLAGLVGVGVWTGYAILLRPAEPVPPGAEVVAVLPFTTSGPGVADFGTGIVSLLTPGLDGVGPIRTVSSRTVLHRWGRRTRRSEPNLDEALRIGRDVGAGSVILGSVVALGDQVRLLAEMRSVDGDRLASADVNGPLPDVLSLVDSLALRLIRNTWRSREPVPELRVSAVTTRSLPALRAFFRGEEFYRHSAWDSAAVFFARASVLDSTFALARFRYADSEIWANHEFTPDALRAMEEAYRHRDRLPPRERSLLLARRLDLAGDVASVDTMTDFVKRYPRSGEGWYYLGDVRFHSRRVLAAAPDAVYGPFDRALQLLPELTPAVIHPLQLAMITGDSVRFRRYLERLRRYPSAEDVDAFTAWGRILWGPTDSLPSELDRTLNQEEPVEWAPLLVAAPLDDRVPPDTLLAALDRRLRKTSSGDPDWTATMSDRLGLLEGLGRLDRVRRELERVWPVDPRLAATLTIRPVLAGIAPPAFAARGIAYLEGRSDPRAEYWKVLYEIATGSPAAGRRRAEALLKRIPAAGADEDQAQLRPYLEAAEGWAGIAAGDTVPGLGRLAGAMKKTSYWSPYFSNVLLYVWGKTLAALPDRRREGIQRLRASNLGEELLVPTWMALGRALEGEGDRDGARRAFREVARLWAGADSGLDGIRAEASAALTRSVGPSSPR